MTIYELMDLMKKSDQLMLVDENGKTYSIDEGTDISKLKNPKFVNVSSKETIYREIFGKQRIHHGDLSDLNEFHQMLLDYMVKNTSPASKKKFKDFIDSK